MLVSGQRKNVWENCFEFFGFKIHVTQLKRSLQKFCRTFAAKMVKSLNPLTKALTSKSIRLNYQFIFQKNKKKQKQIVNGLSIKPSSLNGWQRFWRHKRYYTHSAKTERDKCLKQKCYWPHITRKKRAGSPKLKLFIFWGVLSAREKGICRRSIGGEKETGSQGKGDRDSKFGASKFDDSLSLASLFTLFVFVALEFLKIQTTR